MVKEEQSFPVIINDDGNMNSVVLKVTNRASQQSAILTGDATGITTNQAIKYYENSSAASIPELETDLMLACHHGANTHESNNKRWVDTTSPRATIFSCGKRTDYLHPKCDIVDRYGEKAMPGVPDHFLTCGEDKEFSSPKSTTKAVYSTNDSGTIKAIFEAGKVVMEVEEGSFDIPKRNAVSSPFPMHTPIPATRPLAPRLLSGARVLTFGSSSPFTPGPSHTVVLDSTRKKSAVLSPNTHKADLAEAKSLFRQGKTHEEIIKKFPHLASEVYKFSRGD